MRHSLTAVSSSDFDRGENAWRVVVAGVGTRVVLVAGVGTGVLFVKVGTDLHFVREIEPPDPLNMMSLDAFEWSQLAPQSWC